MIPSESEPAITLAPPLRPLRITPRRFARHRPVPFPTRTRATTPGDWLRSRAPRAAGMSLNRCAISCLIISRLASFAAFFSPPRPSSEPPTAPRAVILFRPGIVRPSPARPPIRPSPLTLSASSRGPPPTFPSVFSVPSVVNSRSSSTVPCPASPLPIRLPELASFAHS